MVGKDGDDTGDLGVPSSGATESMGQGYAETHVLAVPPTPDPEVLVPPPPLNDDAHLHHSLAEGGVKDAAKEALDDAVKKVRHAPCTRSTCICGYTLETTARVPCLSARQT